MSDSNRVAVKYVAESTYGTTPATPTMKTARITSESLGQDTGTTISNELRSDRQVGDFIRTSLSASGALNFEFSYGTFDDLLAAMLQTTSFSTILILPTMSSGTITVAPSGSNFTITRSTGDWTASGLSLTADIGKWIRIAGATDATDNGYHKLVSATPTVLTVKSTSIVAHSASAQTALILARLAEITNGTTFTSFTIQKQFVDLTNKFSYHRGHSPSQMDLNIPADGIVTGSMTFLGTREVSGSSDLATVTTAATTTAVMNGIDNVTAIYLSDTLLSTTTGDVPGLISFGMSMNNNLRARLQIGTLGAVSIGSGSINLSGTLRAYFTSETLLDRYLNFTASSIAVKFVDAAANVYIIDIPQLKYSNGKRVASGLNQDVVADMSWQAYMSPTELISIRIVKV